MTNETSTEPIQYTIGKNDVTYVETRIADGVATRVRIRVNTYDFQSSAYGQIFSPTEARWNTVAQSEPDHWWNRGMTVYGRDDMDRQEDIARVANELFERMEPLRGLVASTLTVEA